MNCYEAIRKAFPEASDKELDELFNSYKDKGTSWSNINDSRFLSECVDHLRSQGFVFGCGAKDGCTPGCTC